MKFVQLLPTVPDLDELVKSYKDATSSGDLFAAGEAQKAVARIAAAEASVAEATTFGKFLDRVHY